ncbi:MAG: hypothetical protein U0804_08230 [Gemmataceae bacterium]
MKVFAAAAMGCAMLIAFGCERPPEPEPQPEQPPAPAPEAKAADAPREVPAALAKVFQERNQLHKRQTGALLTITAKWVDDGRIEPLIRATWSIDYDGPRRPFTILKPGGGENAALLHFWYLDSKGGVATCHTGWGGASYHKEPPKQKSMYAISPDGKAVSGHLERGITSLRGGFGRYPKSGDPSLWAQLEHTPTDRGDGFERHFDPKTGITTKGAGWTLDAWTGKLWSPVVEVVELK